MEVEKLFVFNFVISFSSFTYFLRNLSFNFIFQFEINYYNYYFISLDYSSFLLILTLLYLSQFFKFFLLAFNFVFQFEISCCDYYLISPNYSHSLLILTFLYFFQPFKFFIFKFFTINISFFLFLFMFTSQNKMLRVNNKSNNAFLFASFFFCSLFFFI